MPTTINRCRTTNRGAKYNRKIKWPSSIKGQRTKSHAMRGGTKYGPIRTNLQNKINSYRCLFAQCQMTGSNKPSPAVINKFANMVDKGAMIHKVSGACIAKWYKNATPTYTTSWATKGLKFKFGAAIKAVFPTGNGRTYMVATSPTYKGKPFKFPSR